MRILNTEEITCISGGLSNEIYEFTYIKSTQAAMLLGITGPILVTLGTSSTSLPSIIGAAALTGAVAAPIGFAYCYIILMSAFLYEEYSPIIERGINSYFNL